MTNARERLTQDLQAALRRMRAELDRVELLAAALGAFSRPVPDYRQRLHYFHTKACALDHFKLRSGKPSN
jgi:hypothetical protein